MENMVLMRYVAASKQVLFSSEAVRVEIDCRGKRKKGLDSFAVNILPRNSQTTVLLEGNWVDSKVSVL